MVNEAERRELAAMSMTDKAMQLNALMSSVKALGWTEDLAAQESEVRARWAKLRSRLPHVSPMVWKKS